MTSNRGSNRTQPTVDALTGRRAERSGARLTLRDLSDFCTRWSELRPLADDACAVSDLTDDQREIVGWLILLADRTCGRGESVGD